MKLEDIAESYIERATRVALGELSETSEDDQLLRILFWQRQTDEDRFNATSEIVKRVHLAKGGDPNDLKLNRSIARIGRRKT